LLLRRWKVKSGTSSTANG